MAKTLMDLVSAARGRISEIAPAQLDAEIAAAGDLLLVDVREPDEYRLGHLPGAVPIPRGMIEPSADLQFPNRHPELSQARKRRVVSLLRNRGPVRARMRRPAGDGLRERHEPRRRVRSVAGCGA